MAEADGVLREHVAELRRVLTGEEREYGLQEWLRQEVIRRGGWEPSPATVYRWLNGLTKVDPRLTPVLESLEADAERALRRQIRRVRKGARDR